MHLVGLGLSARKNGGVQIWGADNCLRSSQLNSSTKIPVDEQE